MLPKFENTLYASKCLCGSILLILDDILSFMNYKNLLEK